MLTLVILLLLLYQYESILNNSHPDPLKKEPKFEYHVIINMSINMTENELLTPQSTYRSSFHPRICAKTLSLLYHF